MITCTRWGQRMTTYLLYWPRPGLLTSLLRLWACFFHVHSLWLVLLLPLSPWRYSFTIKKRKPQALSLEANLHIQNETLGDTVSVESVSSCFLRAETGWIFRMQLNFFAIFHYQRQSEQTDTVCSHGTEKKPLQRPLPVLSIAPQWKYIYLHKLMIILVGTQDLCCYS